MMMRNICMQAFKARTMNRSVQLLPLHNSPALRMFSGTGKWNEIIFEQQILILTTLFLLI